MGLDVKKCHLESDELLEFYETHYFHEVDMREKLLSRVQVSFALIASLGSLLFYLISNLHAFSWQSTYCALFAVLFAISIGFLCISSYYFLKSFFSYTYRFVPTAKDTENYRKVLVDFYKEYDNCDELVSTHFKEYLLNAYIDSASDNAENNAWRSAHFHNTVKYLIPAYLMAIFALLFFYIAKVSKAPDSNVNVRIVEPVQIKGGFVMPDTKNSSNPPPPPPPPPLRQIKEGFEVTKPSVAPSSKKDK